MITNPLYYSDLADSLIIFQLYDLVLNNLGDVCLAVEEAGNYKILATAVRRGHLEAVTEFVMHPDIDIAVGLAVRSLPICLAG